MSKKKRKDSRYYRIYNDDMNSSNKSDSTSNNLSDDFKSLVDDVKEIFTNNKKVSYGKHGKAFNLKKWNKKIMKKDKINSVFIILGILGLLFIISRIGIPIAVIFLIGVLVYIILS